MTEPTDRSSTDAPHALGWAAYLGASWTWVIGMFLPVLLIRDFGPAGWFVFAIPNVVGAAAMGWAIRSREHSLRFVASHRPACRAFSLVTIAFHFYVLLWLVPRLLGAGAGAIAFGAALVVLLPLLTTTLRATALAIATLVASVLIAVALLGTESLGWPIAPGRQSSVDLAALGVVCVLGFLTCPYLDLTFHRASQACRTPGESRVAFGVGFGVCFCAMIVLTLLYANVFYAGPAATRVPRAMIAIHLCLQSLFTIGAHGAAFRAATPDDRRTLAATVAAAAIPTLLALVVHAATRGDGAVAGLSIGEIVYRTFLAFYGLLAPTYVIICIRRADAPPDPHAVGVAAIAILIAAPFFWVGFMHGSMRWATPGVLAIGVAWVVVTAARRTADARERAFKSIGGHLR